MEAPKPILTNFETSTLKRVDELVLSMGFSNRSEFIRSAVKEKVDRLLISSEPEGKG